ncbi:MAG: hypothetical protein IPM50_12725 [Acidobacteriota bacterium]|nr:MAG: hypothetical protein IPM50_12725 [Acidobacteriota bacterium]
MSTQNRFKSSERGSAGVKFAVFLVILGLLAHAGYNYVPVAYNAESLKTDMQQAVVQGLALPGKIDPVENVRNRIHASTQKNGAPPDTLIDVKQKGNVISARVSFTKEVNILPFGLYKHKYNFDHTATPTGFLVDSMN